MPLAMSGNYGGQNKAEEKSAGIRVIYYWKKYNNEIWMLTVYGKNERSSIPSHILRKIAEELKND